ncbi:putative 2-aminoethylphosphonate transport system permease protein PhnV [Agrobacterium sp. DSM 25558]|uniref:ABC transporter permease n=1 Tax=Agrobacterium sp. DSM 25558 TaxID=1907665 RepID=UPI0009724B07|nr:ABC transporter permease [Agrobacterium sp. DSM 25558]SCX19514.1 putative 2-aminoethylphosphonate transport system permease protein PhnV [Agrobacterium sp. DSM 25558]
MPIKLTKFAFASLTILFLIAPLIAIMPLAFTPSVILTYPIPSWSLRWFEELLTADAWRRAIINSFIIGTGTTLLATVLGTAASLGLRNRLLFFRGTIRTLFLLPMVVPAVVLGVGMQVLLARFGLTNSYVGVIIAHTVVAVPFVVVSVTGALSGIDARIELAAQSLGAAPTTVFRRVTLPLAMPGVLSGAVLAFATSLDEVVLTLFVAGPNQRTLARQMFSSIRENISPAIAAAAFLFIVMTILIGLIVIMSRLALAKRR